MFPGDRLVMPKRDQQSWHLNVRAGEGAAPSSDRIGCGGNPPAHVKNTLALILCKQKNQASRPKGPCARRLVSVWKSVSYVYPPRVIAGSPPACQAGDDAIQSPPQVPLSSPRSVPTWRSALVRAAHSNGGHFRSSARNCRDSLSTLHPQGPRGAPIFPLAASLTGYLPSAHDHPNTQAVRSPRTEHH
jgi:hypothetical protein